MGVIGAKPNAMLAVGEDVQFIRDVVGGEGIGEEQGILHRHDRVIGGMP